MPETSWKLCVDQEKPCPCGRNSLLTCRFCTSICISNLRPNEHPNWTFHCSPCRYAERAPRRLRCLDPLAQSLHPGTSGLLGGLGLRDLGFRVRVQERCFGGAQGGGGVGFFSPLFFSQVWRVFFFSYVWRESLFLWCFFFLVFPHVYPAEAAFFS